MADQVPSKELAERLRALDFGVRMPPSVIEEAAEFLEKLTHEPPADAPRPHWSEALQDDIYYASEIDPYIARLRASQPPPAGDAAFPLDTRVRLVLKPDRTGTIVAIDTKYEVEGDDGEYWQAWHRALERHSETKGAEQS